MLDNSKKITALIPMKGNSERVKNKNIRDFAGQPLLTHVIETFSKSKYISNIIINTDSQKIADLAKSVSDKVIIHERPEEICGDYVSMNDIINHDIQQVEEEYFIQTHVTNPLLTLESVDKAIEFYFENKANYNSIFSVTKIQTRLFWEDGKPVNHNPKELIRTQDLPPVFEENSNFYIFSKEAFVEAGGKRIGTKPKMFEIGQIESMDIDNEDDFILSEYIKKMQNDQK
jgi:CMP-N-acetylneuraminic acid synthetase